jgi:single-stranded DNA-binding protein
MEVINFVELEGNVGKTGISKFKTKNKIKGVRFSLAVANSSMNNTPTWVTCFAYATVAEGIISSKVKKGSRIHIKGELRLNKDNNLCVYVEKGFAKRV